MKKLIMFLSIFAFSVPVALADPPQRKVIQAPQKPQVVRSQPREFTRPPTARPTIPGKQQWQKPQVEQPRVESKHSFGFYNYYRPVNPHFRYYRVPSYYPPVIIQPPVVIQPQPVPVYPGPFHGFFFHFRF